MKYYLKAIGASKVANANQDFIKRLEHKDVDMKFWEDNCKVWLNSMPQLNIGDIFIIYVVKKEPRSNELFGWRILGYCEIASQIKNNSSLEDKWFKYVIVNNLAKSFSEKSKTRELLNIANYNMNFNKGTIRRGYTEIDEEIAKIIIKDINENN